MATAVPLPTFGLTGVVAPSEAAILAGVQADQDAAFGGALNHDASTPQGQLAASETAILGALNDLLLYYVNQVDPAYASGRMQDALGRIYFLERKAALSTTVTATCIGASGTVIPAGALAVAADGNIYSCTSGGTIPAGGSIDLAFACTVTGPIQCPAGSLNTIYRQISGWDTINNAADGAVGRDVETRAAFEARRSASVALNSSGQVGAILAAVKNVPGVTSAYAVDNPSGSSATIGGVSVAARSIYVAAVGGADLDVARAILSRKAPGCGYVGSTSVVVTDPNPLYTAPPSYTVKFQRPAPLTINFAVQIANAPDVPANAAALIQSAILAAFVGEDGGPAVDIGATVYASRFYAGVASLGSWARIVSITVNTAASQAVTIGQIPVTAASNITVTLV